MVSNVPGSPNDRIPVLVLTGFLGSGKTSLLNAALRTPAFRNSAVVVNEFGDIGLDHLLVESARDNIVLMDAGCLCCALLDSLPETLSDLFGRRARGETPAFERVIIETSGLADPRPILQALMRDPMASHFYRLAGVVCVVDALHGEGQLGEHPEARAQIAIADRLVITKVDLTGGHAPTALSAKLARANPTAERVDSRLASDGAHLFLNEGLAGRPWLNGLADPDSPHVHSEHETDAVALSFWVEAPATWSGISAWTAFLRRRFGASLWRCKAILKVSGVEGPVVLHGVQTVFDVQRLPSWSDHERRSRIVLIGRDLNIEDVQASLALLSREEGLQPYD